MVTPPAKHPARKKYRLLTPWQPVVILQATGRNADTHCQLENIVCDSTY